MRWFDIAKMKSITRDNHIKAAVASGGSLARKLVNDTKPDMIIAVACHRDLTEGVRDSWRYPVYSVLNERPKGPCFETTVSYSVIDFAAKEIHIKGENLETHQSFHRYSDPVAKSPLSRWL